MNNSVALVVALTLILSGTPILSLTSVSFDNNYAVFRPSDKGLGFDLEKHVEILFLERLEEPSLESSRFALRIIRNHTKNDELVDFILYKNGIAKNRVTYDIDDLSSLRNMELAWDMTSGPSIQISVKKFAYRSTAFSWADSENGSPVNITYIAFKASHPITIRLRDSFLWISDVFSACPYQEAEISCEMFINKHRSTSLDERNNNSNVSKGVRKVMEMKLISKHSSSQRNYEMLIAANQTTDKVEPRLHIVQQNTTKLRMDTIAGPLNLGVNMSGGHILLSKRNDSMPFLLWKDPVVVNSESHGFQDIRYVTVEVSESAGSRSHNHGNDKSIVNACEITCKEFEDKRPWYIRWFSFGRKESIPPVHAVDES